MRRDDGARMARHRSAEAAAVRAAIRLEGTRDDPEGRAAALRSTDDPARGGASRSPALAYGSRVVSGRWIAAVGRRRQTPRRARRASGADCAEWGAPAAAHVLFTSRDAGRAGARDSGAGGTQGSVDDAALHAPQSGGAR